MPSIIFGIFVFAPFVLNFFVSNTSYIDNRAPKKRPEKVNLAFPKNYNAYYNDSFAFRKELVELYHRLRERLHIANGGMVFHGLDGWLMFDSEKRSSSDDNIADFIGRRDYSEEQLAAALKDLSALNAYAKKRGIEYSLFVAPNKENVHSEFMPAAYLKARASETSRMDRALRFINKNSDVKIHNLKPLLLAKKGQVPYPLYFKTDTHWNEMGAYVGLEQMARAFNIKIPPFEEVVFTPREQPFGDLGKMILLTGTDYGYDYEFLPEITSSCIHNADKPDPENSSCASTNENAPRALILRDSFGMAILPRLPKMFSETIMLRNPKASAVLQAINDFKPDIIVELKVERSFDYFFKRKFDEELKNNHIL